LHLPINRNLKKDVPVRRTVTLTILSLIFIPSLSWGYASAFGPTENQTRNEQQLDDVASRFRQCFQNHLNRGQDRVTAGIECSGGMTAELESMTSDPQEMANWQWYICTQLSIDKGFSASVAASACAHVTLVEPEADSVSEDTSASL